MSELRHRSSKLKLPCTKYEYNVVAVQYDFETHGSVDANFREKAAEENVSILEECDGKNYETSILKFSTFH
jgi:hypothetical protein